MLALHDNYCNYDSRKSLSCQIKFFKSFFYYLSLLYFNCGRWTHERYFVRDQRFHISHCFHLFLKQQISLLTLENRGHRSLYNERFVISLERANDDAKHDSSLNDCDVGEPKF